MKEYSIIGKAIPQVESREKASGTITYIDDIILPGMLYAKILRSPYAHAKIIDIDTTKAERLPGVKSVITSRNTRMVKFGLGPTAPQDEYPLCVDKVHYVGDPVAAVAAVDEDTAEEALELVKVKYEELPAVFNQEEAMKPGAPNVHDACEDNVPYRVTHIFGDLDKGFAESDYIREDRFEVPMVTPAYLGTRGAVSSFDPATGNLTLYVESHQLFGSRSAFSRILEIPQDKLRVIGTYIAGGFGAKGGPAIDLSVSTAFLSMRTGKPVKVVRSREEEFGATRGREPLIVYFKTGVKKDGTLVAMECRHIANAGAYFGMSGINCRQNAGIFDLLFRCPNVKYDAYVVYTNTIPSGTFRGLTNNPFTFGQLSHLDMIARELGMDTVDLYLKNVHQKGDVTTAKYKLDSCGLSECIQEVVKTSSWKEKRGKLPLNRGIGFSLASHTCGTMGGGSDLSTASVTVDERGKVSVLSARGEAGQGPTTMIVMCVAEELGLPVEEITINRFVDTDVTPFDHGNYGSRGTIQQGNAAVAAARDVRRQLFEVVADKLGVDPGDLEAGDSRIYVKVSPDRGVSFNEAVKAYQAAGKTLPLTGHGHYEPPTVPPDPKTGEGNLSIAYGFAARAIEVEVNTETGQVKVLNVYTADDCGKVINPLILEGLSQGGISQGIGMALFEGIQYNEKGEILNASYSDYRLPTIWQTPQNIKQTWVETMDPYGPYGAKGIAEVVSLGIAPAIANAIYDAIGVRFYDLPITPEKILNALAKGGGKG